MDAGLVRFLGVVPPHVTGAVLSEHDVYLLPSEFEGMPNPLLEAMGHGCVPVTMRMESGVPELPRDDDNGFLVPIGDASAFAERLRALWNDPPRREAMSRRAFELKDAARFLPDSPGAPEDGLFDNPAFGYSIRGVARRALGDRAGARQDFDRVLRLQPLLLSAAAAKTDVDD